MCHVGSGITAQDDGLQKRRAGLRVQLVGYKDVLRLSRLLARRRIFVIDISEHPDFRIITLSGIVIMHDPKTSILAAGVMYSIISCRGLMTYWILTQTCAQISRISVEKAGH